MSITYNPSTKELRRGFEHLEYRKTYWDFINRGKCGYIEPQKIEKTHDHGWYTWLK